MQNFSEFLRKYSRLLLFIVLQIVAFILIFYNNNFQKVLIFNTSNAVTGAVYQQYSLFNAFLNLRNDNELLATENASLRAQLLKDKYKVYSGGVMVKDTTYKQVYSYIPAIIVNNTVDKANNYITLNVGELHGIKPDMGVISEDGVVGIVKSVSKHFSVAISLLHSKSAVSAEIKNTNHFGTIQWDGISPKQIFLEYIPSYASVKENDTIVTTGYSSVFPQGVNVGTVEGFTVNPNEGYINLKLRPTVDFKKVRYVYVVNYLLKNEQKELEAQAAKNDK
jgi:rod shape-determining protein MreC